MVLIGIGSNVASPRHGSPRRVCEAALAALAARGVRVRRCSRWYRSAPLPPSDQPWFVNGVAAVDTALTPRALLARLHAVETALGRTRDGGRWGPRIIDLDLLAYDDRVAAGGAPGAPVLPHPRLHERAFVLLPLRDVAPGWRHPASAVTVERMLADLGPTQDIVLLQG